MFEDIVIKNPKRNRKVDGVESWYPYYAGFSKEFVSSILSSRDVDSNACIVDPWNGSGTTTSAAFEKGLRAHGFDLSPVMVIAARACVLPSSEKSSLIPLSTEIVEKAKNLVTQQEYLDPLNTWFLSKGSEDVRRLERSIHKILVNDKGTSLPYSNSDVESMSSIAAFFYVALFRALRKLLKEFKASNPTWIKMPESGVHKLRPSFEFIAATFLEEVKVMVSQFPDRVSNGNGVHIGVSSSCSSSLPTSSADLLISSPPYCTRIDYAVATLPELTLLGFDKEGLDHLRREMIGTSTVPKETPIINEGWGSTCHSLLKNISNHKSKASHSYYYKNHVQYFDSMHKSLNQISRILKPNGVGVLVVQDSYYKDIHNDLAKIVIEMSESNGLELVRRKDFLSSQNMSGINPRIKKYRKSFKATESVLFIRK